MCIIKIYTCWRQICLNSAFQVVLVLTPPIRSSRFECFTLFRFEYFTFSPSVDQYEWGFFALLHQLRCARNSGYGLVFRAHIEEMIGVVSPLAFSDTWFKEAGKSSSISLCSGCVTVAICADCRLLSIYGCSYCTSGVKDPLAPLRVGRVVTVLLGLTGFTT